MHRTPLPGLAIGPMTRLVLASFEFENQLQNRFLLDAKSSEANYAASAASGSQKMASWLTRMLQETGFECSSPTDTNIAQFAEVPNSAAASPAVAEATAVAEFTPAPVYDRRRRRRRRDEQGTRRRDRDRRRQEEDDAALARRLAAEDESEDADRDTVACRACGQRLAASVDAIEAHSLHCAAEASEAWAHAAARCREDPDGLVGAAVEVRGRGKGVVVAICVEINLHAIEHRGDVSRSA